VIEFMEGLCSAGTTASAVCREREAVAKTACANVTTELDTRASCEYDIVATGDAARVVLNEAYVNPLVGQPPEICAAGSGGATCQSLGGECVFRCDSLVNACRSDLCQVTNVTGCSCALPLAPSVPTAPRPQPSVPSVPSGPAPAAPSAPRAAPVGPPSGRRCGLMRLSLFCPRTRCGLLGRIFKMCKKTNQKQ
jgi:hypothetical protein